MFNTTLLTSNKPEPSPASTERIQRLWFLREYYAATKKTSLSRTFNKRGNANDMLSVFVGGDYKSITVLFKIHKYMFYFYTRTKKKTSEDICEVCLLVISEVRVNTLCSHRLRRRLCWKATFEPLREG